MRYRIQEQKQCGMTVYVLYVNEKRVGQHMSVEGCMTQLKKLYR